MGFLVGILHSPFQTPGCIASQIIFNSRLTIYSSTWKRKCDIVERYFTWWNNLLLEVRGVYSLILISDLILEMFFSFFVGKWCNFTIQRTACSHFATSSSSTLIPFDVPPFQPSPLHFLPLSILYLPQFILYILLSLLPSSILLTSRSSFLYRKTRIPVAHLHCYC